MYQPTSLLVNISVWKIRGARVVTDMQLYPMETVKKLLMRMATDISPRRRLF